MISTTKSVNGIVSSITTTYTHPVNNVRLFTVCGVLSYAPDGTCCNYFGVPYIVYLSHLRVRLTLFNLHLSNQLTDFLSKYDPFDHDKILHLKRQQMLSCQVQNYIMINTKQFEWHQIIEFWEMKIVSDTFLRTHPTQRLWWSLRCDHEVTVAKLVPTWNLYRSLPLEGKYEDRWQSPHYIFFP